MIRIDTSFANAIKVGNDYYPLNGYLTASAYLTTGVTITDRTLNRVIAKGIPFADYVDASTGLRLGATQAATITALNTAFNAVGDSGIDVQNLDDVTLTSLSVGQILAYNASLGQWINVDKPADPAVEDNGGTPVLASGITQAEMQTVLNVDPAGTDNSTDVSVGATATDVLKMAAGQSLGAYDAGVDKLVFWDQSDSKLTYATIGTNLTMTGTTLSAAGGNFYLNRFDSTASTMASTLDAGTATIERIDTARWTGTGVYLNQQSDIPSAGNAIKRKVYYKNEFGSTDAFGTWTLIHEFADDTSYADALTYINDTIIAGQTNGTAPASLVMTWEDTASFVGLLDDYPGAAAAYSLRLLDSTYTGSAIRVRRASDNAEQDIGFDSNNELDTSALATFCSGTNGFVRTLYDQSGNGNDLTQTTTGSQPKVYDISTGVVTENGKSAIQMDSNTKKLSVPNSKATFKFLHDGGLSSTNYVVSPTNARETSGTTSKELFETGQYSSSIGLEIVYTSSQFSGTEIARFTVKNGTGTAVDYTTPAQSFDIGQNLLTFYIDADNTTAADRLKVGLNGETLLTGNTSTAAPSTANSQLDFTIYGGFVAHWQEVVVWNADKSTDRSGIESNINDFYSIYP